MSTEKQAFGPGRHSLESQVYEIKTFVSEKRLKFWIPHRVIESGYFFGPKVRAVAAFARSEGRVLIVSGLDRFSRLPLERVFTILESQDIYLLVLDGVGQPSSIDTIISEDHRSERRIRSRAKSRSDRYRTSLPDAKKAGRKKKLDKVPKYSRECLLDKIKELRWGGKSLRGIADELNKDLQDGARPWNPMAVKRILNEAGWG